jgi:hypothetical protein
MWVLFSGVRLFNIMLLMRSVPTALLLDFGRHRLISAGVMGSLTMVWEVDRILDIMACWNCGLGGILDGNTLLKCSANTSDFLRGSSIETPSIVMLVPSGEWFTPLLAMRFRMTTSGVDRESRGWR